MPYEKQIYLRGPKGDKGEKGDPGRNGGLTTVHVTDPLTIEGLDDNPTIGIRASSTSQSGYMSAEQATRLADLSEGNVTQSEKDTWNAKVDPGTTLAHYGITDAAPYSHVGSRGTSHGLANDSYAGFMSSSDFIKLRDLPNQSYTHPNHYGDVTSVNDTSTVISNNVVTNAKLTDMAKNTFKGRYTQTTGDPEDLTVEQVKQILDILHVEDKSPSDILAGLVKKDVTDALGFTPEDASKKNVANGYVGLDSTTKIPTSYIPTSVVNGTGLATLTRRKMLVEQNNVGRKKYTWNSVAATNATQVALCCIDVHGMGFQNGSTGVQSYSRIKFTLSSWDKGTTMEATLHRSGLNWRLDLQNHLGGGVNSNDYYASSRGMMFDPNTALSVSSGSNYGYYKGVTGWRVDGMASSNTGNTSLGLHKHEDYGNPGIFDGYAMESATDAWNSGHTHTIAAHDHTFTNIYKAKGSFGGNTYESYSDTTSSASALGLKFYTVNGSTETELESPYIVRTGDYVKVYITNIPVYSGYRSVVNSTIEFDRCNHTIWFFDSERYILYGGDAWEARPIVGVTGASDTRGTDLNSMISSGYDYIWSEARGYWNYARNGDMAYETLSRMRINSGELELSSDGTNWVDKNFTHVIIGVGTNDSTNKVLKARGVTTRNIAAIVDGTYYPTGWQAINAWNQNDIVGYVKECVDKVKSATARTITPIILLFSSLKDGQSLIDTGGNWPVYSLTDGSSAGTMTKTDWDNIKTEWESVSNSIYEYATDNGIQVIDWYALSENHRFDNSNGSLMAVGGHYNINGWLKVAEYVDVTRRI